MVRNECPGPWSDNPCSWSMKLAPCILAEMETMPRDRISSRPHYLVHQRRLRRSEKVAQVICKILPSSRSCPQMPPMIFLALSTKIAQSSRNSQRLNPENPQKHKLCRIDGFDRCPMSLCHVHQLPSDNMNYDLHT